MSNYRFYDIECLNNLFTNTIYFENENHLAIFILFDNTHVSNKFDYKSKEFLQLLSSEIQKVNPDFNGKFSYHFLDGNEKQIEKSYINMIRALGGISNQATIYTEDKTDINKYNLLFPTNTDAIKIKPDIEFMKNEEDPLYIMGYNSSEYDLTVIASIYDELLQKETQEVDVIEDGKKTKDEQEIISLNTNLKPGLIREYSDALFTSNFRGKGNKMSNYLQYPHGSYSYDDKDYNNNKNLIYKNWMRSGNHLDIMNMKSSANPIALKRLLGLLGRQIVEPKVAMRNGAVIKTKEEFIDLICYNVSDVINLPFVFKDGSYYSGFQTKTLMLKEYPELIFQQKKDSQDPDKFGKVRTDRLKADDTSAKFSATSLFPYSKAEDISCISYLFPSEEIAEEYGIEQIDVLEFCNEQFKNWFKNESLRKEWQRIYDFYDKLRGLNINFSQNATFRKLKNPLSVKEYDEDKVRDILKDIKNRDTSLIYYDKYGNPTSCYVIFKTGGIHGAEYHIEQYKKDMEQYEIEKKEINKIKAIHSTPENLEHRINLANEEWKEQKKIARKEKRELPEEPDIFKLKDCYSRKGKKLTGYTYSWKEPKEVKLFTVESKKGTTLNDKYKFTSAYHCIHMDFESYYPFLLKLLSAFINKVTNQDRYSENIEYKREYGIKRKQAKTEKEANFFAALREAVKLTLNSASGYADAPFDNVIRMNNLTTSMRMIGQLFTWFIGQSQSIIGGLPVSTNTDGLYVVNDNWDEATELLAKDAENIHINIEPEKMFLVSKDTNNRIEFNDEITSVDKVNGGSVSAYKGPNIGKALDHPAFYDYLVVEYIATIKNNPNLINEPMDLEIVKDIVDKFKQTKTPIKQLLYLQNILANGSSTLTFNITKNHETGEMGTMQKVNRIFLMKDGTPNTFNIESVTFKKLTPAMIAKRKKENQKLLQHDLKALEMLKKSGVTDDEVIEKESDMKEATFKKVKGIDQTWDVYIQNKSLYHLSKEEINFILTNIDWDKYITESAKTFNEDWSNYDTKLLNTI